MNSSLKTRGKIKNITVIASNWAPCTGVCENVIWNDRFGHKKMFFIPYSVSAALKGVLKRVRQTRSWYRSWFSKPFVNCPMLRIYQFEASLQSRLKSVCYYRIWSFWNCIVLWLHLVWKTVSYHRYLNGLQTACKKTIFNRLFKDSFSNRRSKRLTGCRGSQDC